MARAEDLDQLLTELAETVDQLAELTLRPDALVARARAAGATWAELAAVLDVTVQAAHKRYRENAPVLVHPEVRCCWPSRGPASNDRWSATSKVPGTPT